VRRAVPLEQPLGGPRIEDSDVRARHDIAEVVHYTVTHHTGASKDDAALVIHLE
jgi:hypothetical protein